MMSYNIENDSIKKAVSINTNEGKFLMAVLGNFDLYWMPITYNEKGDKLTYYITKENYYLFKLFEEVLNRIIAYQDFEDKLLKDIRKYLVSQKLVKEKEVNWYSDEDEIEKASLLKISKEDDEIKIVFEKNKENKLYSVKICNSGSRYYPANAIFMDLYNKIMYMNDDYYPQIHMEEYLYSKRKVLKR